MTVEEYLRDPCAAASLPYWKLSAFPVPEGVRLLHDTDPAPRRDPSWRDDPYFRLRHDLREIPASALPEGFLLRRATPEEVAAHIRLCYENAAFTALDLRAGLCGGAVRPELCLAVCAGDASPIAATGVASLDPALREASLEWVQVSPGLRRRGLGRGLVCALLSAMRDRADFATVSGRILAPDRPERLYRACGFTGRDVWHVLTREE